MLITEFGLLAVHVKLHGPEQPEKHKINRHESICQAELPMVWL